MIIRIAERKRAEDSDVQTRANRREMGSRMAFLVAGIVAKEKE